MHSTDTAPVGGRVFRTLGSWDERTTTWNTRPSLETTPVASIGAVSAKTWYEVALPLDVLRSGVVSLGIDSTSSNGARWSSRESATAPRCSSPWRRSPCPPRRLRPRRLRRRRPRPPRRRSRRSRRRRRRSRRPPRRESPSPTSSPQPTTSPSPTSSPEPTSSPTPTTAPQPTPGPAPVDGLSSLASSSVGSSEPTYYTGNSRLAVTRGGRLLAVHGRHTSGVQLAWRDPACSSADRLPRRRQQRRSPDRHRHGRLARVHRHHDGRRRRARLGRVGGPELRGHPPRPDEAAERPRRRGRPEPRTGRHGGRTSAGRLPG